MEIVLFLFFGVVMGFLAGGSPKTERMRGLDAQRESDLEDISSCINRYAKEFKRLPATLEQLKNSSYSYCAGKVDPETGKAYEYRVVESSRTVGKNKEGQFELCANFSLASEENITTSKSYYNSRDSMWEVHAAGRECDTMKVVIDTLEK